jgi:hypothetical protein
LIRTGQASPNVEHRPLSSSSLPAQPVGPPHFVFERGLLASSYLVHALPWRYPWFCWLCSSEFLEMSTGAPAPARKVRVKRADLPLGFYSYSRPNGELLVDFAAVCGEKQGLRPESITFYLLESAQVGGVNKNLQAAPLGVLLEPTYSIETDCWLLVFGEQAGESPVRKSSLVSFRLPSLLSTATHFNRSLLFAVLLCSGDWWWWRRGTNR